METIDTAEKGWQKKMSKLMKSNATFVLTTKDEELAQAFETGKYTHSAIKILVVGSGAVVGVGGAAAVLPALMAIAVVGPDPVSKVMSLVTLFAFGCLFLAYVIKILVNTRYRFEGSCNQTTGIWTFEAKPV